MAQPSDLGLDALHDFRMAVAHRRREDSAEEVQILAALHIAHPNTRAFV